MQARKDNQTSLETTSKNLNMLHSNNQYFYNDSPKNDGDNLTEIDAKSESSYGGGASVL